jgi:hypothetical protein
MYAWDSAATGDEVTPRWSMPDDPYTEAVRIWCRDREIHIIADIAYAVWQYWQATGDDILGAFNSRTRVPSQRLTCLPPGLASNLNYTGSATGTASN